MRRATLSTLLVLGLLTAATPARAQSAPPPGVQTYYGLDSGPNYSEQSFPSDGNAAAARSAFDGSIRLETVGLESFEAPGFTAENDANKRGSLSVSFDGSGTSLTTRATVPGTFTGLASDQYTIRDDTNFGTFATDGSQFLGSSEGYIEVNFDVPVSAFGFYGTDFGEGTTEGLKITMYEVDGAVYTKTFTVRDGLPRLPSGSLLFFGFTDQERQYHRVDIQAVDAGGGLSDEYFGFDSFIIADVNQVAGAEFADADGSGPGSAVASAVEGETIRLLLRIDEAAFPNGGEVDVVLTGGTGDAADLDDYQTVRAVIEPGEVPAGETGAGSDYNLVAVPVSITLDAVPDDGETFVFTLQNGSGAFASRDGETLVLTVGDPLPVFSQSVAPAPAAEDVPATYTFTVDNSGNGRAQAGLSISTALPTGLAVASPANTSSTCGGTVTASGRDIDFAGGAVAGDAVCAVTVDVVASAAGDLTVPPVFLDTDRGPTQADGFTLSVLPSVSFAAASGSASEGGAVPLAATLSSPAPAGGASVEVALVSGAPTTGSAADVDDYTTQTLTFNAGSTTATSTVTVDVTDDGLTEGAETFRFALQNASGTAPGSPSTFDLTVAASGPRAAFVATSGASPPQVAAGSSVTVDAVEGDQVTLTVRLSDGAAGGESVDVVLVPGAPTTGSAADLGDYTTQTVSFAAGETEKTVTVTVTPDGVAEDAETVRLALQNAQGGLTLGGAAAFDLGIAESFAGASFAGATASAAEGGAATITLRLSAPAQGGETADVVLSTGAQTTGTAADLGNYATQTVTFSVGETERSITVPVTADQQAEPEETFRFTLGGVTDPSGQQTLDLTVAASNATAAFARASASAVEGDDVTVTVALTGPALGGEAVDVALASGDPADLDGFTTRRVTFAAGDESASFTVPVTEDGQADRDEAFTFALENPTRLDLGTPATFDLAVDPTGAFLSFDAVQSVAGEGAGSYAIALSLSDELDSPASVTISLASGDPADLGGFTTRTVAIAPGASSLLIDIPITDDAAEEGDETFSFVLSDPQGNDPDGISVDRSVFGLVVVDNDGAGGSAGGGGGGGVGGGAGSRPVVVATPPRDANGDGVEDGGPRYLAVPVSGLTAGDVAAAAAGDGPRPTVYVLDPATGALVAVDPALVLAAGQPVYVDVAPGAGLTFSGDAPSGAVSFAPTTARDGRVFVAVGNPAGDPVRLSDLRVRGGTLADVVLVLNPATGAFEPVSIGSLGDDEDTILGYGSVVVQVIPSGDAGDVSVALDLSAADAGLDASASGLVGDRCAPSSGDEVAVCVALGTGGSAPGERDRVVVRLRPAAADLRGQGRTIDPYDGLDLAAPDSTRLALPGGVDGATALAALSTPFAVDSTITVPLDVAVAEPGAYTLALTHVVEAFRGQGLEVVLVDGTRDVVLEPGEPYEFDVAHCDELAGRFALFIGRRRAVSTDDRPALADAVGVPFPNPTAGGAALDVAVSEAQAVRVTVYDALGRRVAVAFDGEVRPGAPARIALGGAALAPGVYVVRVDGATVREARRLTVTR